jgi:hypothetical protein
MFPDYAKIGLILGSAAVTFSITCYTVIIPIHEVMKPIADKIRKCEENLPRNELCLIVAVPQTSVKDSK